jgi:hypothetical protein
LLYLFELILTRYSHFFPAGKLGQVTRYSSSGKNLVHSF